MPSPFSTHKPKMRTFHIAMWVIGLIAFLELFLIGLALAKRLDQDKSPRVISVEAKPKLETSSLSVKPNAIPEDQLPRSVEEILASVPDIIPGQVSYRVAQSEDSNQALESAPDFGAPLIVDPKIERLVLDARKAFVSSDVRKALLKLEEAKSIDKQEPNVLYHIATVYEAMGQFSKASDYYQRVIEKGADAGSLYSLAAKKLTQGFDNRLEMIDSMSVGTIHEFRNESLSEINEVILSVPIQAAPEKEINPKKVEVRVNIFDRDNKGFIVPALPQHKPQYEWTTDTVDWQGTGEELLQVTYSLPRSQTNVSMELRKYYGYLVQLFYDGELIDLDARPRILFSKLKDFRKNAEALGNSSQEVDVFNFPIEDSNPYNPLLPPLPQR